MSKIDARKLNTAVDLRDLVGQHTTLTKWATDELAGPCPKCGGEDRFHVKDDWFYCNQCYPYDNGESHDAIGFVMWLMETEKGPVCFLSNGAEYLFRFDPDNLGRIVIDKCQVDSFVNMIPAINIGSWAGLWPRPHVKIGQKITVEGDVLTLNLGRVRQLQNVKLLKAE